MSELRIGLIGGSGLGQALGAATSGTQHEIDTPFGRPSDAILETEWAGVPIFVLPRHGAGHTIPPSQVPSRANIYALKQLGCTHVIASGAVGSLREEFKPRHLVIPDQVIDKTNRRPGTFFENAAVHVEFAQPFCPVLRRILLEAGRGEEESGRRGDKETGRGGDREKDESQSPSLDTRHSTLDTSLVVHDGGCYVCMEGPAFSTRAESLMHRLWGGDLIGMTAMPEAKLAREAEISYALVALVTDYDCWRQKPPVEPSSGEAPVPVDPHVLLKEIMGNLAAATDNGIALIKRAVELLAQRRDEALAAPARSALRLAIWTDKSRIARDEVERLWPLWGHYFEHAEPNAPSQPRDERRSDAGAVEPSQA